MKRPIPTTGKSQIHMPSVQHRCRHSRAQGGQDQQEGSPALREFLLFDHSRFQFSPLRCPLCIAPALFPGLKFSPTLGSGTQSALHDDTHARHNARKFGNGPQLPVRDRRCTASPIVRLLFANRGHYHRDRSIEGAQGLVLVRRLFLRALIDPLESVSRRMISS